VREGLAPLPEGFVPLVETLRAPRREPEAPGTHAGVVPRTQTDDAPLAQIGQARLAQAGDPPRADANHPFATLVGEIALARLAAHEAYERAVPRLLEALARDVLARELVVSPPDLAALSRSLAAEFANDEPVAFAIAREDLACFPPGLPVRVDPRLRAGDVVLEVRDGEIDARFAVRVRSAIDAAAT
jgi:flagellar biosynthesis/type III secretory pathway protein FliH